MEVNPGAATPAKAPPATLPWTPGQSRQMDAETAAQWVTRTDRGYTKAEQFHPQWKRGLGSYVKAKSGEAKADVDALLDYRHVESKKSKLFHRTPDVNLSQVDPLDATIPYAQLLPLRQKFLNHDLGPKGANAKRALHKTLIDTLAASGFLITELGYEQVALPDPLTQAQVPIWSRRYISAVSSMKLILPEDFHDSSDFDAAPWIAIKGTIQVAEARRQRWDLPADCAGTAQGDTAIFDHDLPAPAASESALEYVKIWYRASLFDPTVFNPELYRLLILVKGSETPALHKDSPFQTLTPQGQLTDDSMIGNPIHVGTLRDLTDSCYVPSDLVVGEQLSRELNKFRTDLVNNRTQRSPITLVSDAIGADLAAKILKDRKAIVPGEHIGDAGTQRIVAIVQAGTEPRDNYTAQDIIERDQEEALGEGANQRGQTSRKKTTATEARIVQGNSSARAETEKDRIRDYFVALVRKYDTVVQRTATQAELAKVLGTQGAALWEAWRALPGKYAYDVLPDAGQYIDIPQARSQWLEKYTLLRKDERVNPDDLLAEGARLWNRDPAKFINPPADKTIEPPKASVSFKGDDTINPAMGNLLIDFCANGGVKLRPETIAAFAAQHQAQLAAAAAGGGMAVGMDSDPNAHGGSAPQAEPVNKHQLERTGGVQGVGVQ